MWDWRGDMIYWNGATQPKDVRLRYTNLIQFYDEVNPADFPTTPLPFRESVDCLAYLMAAEFCEPRLPPGATAELTAKYDKEIAKVINRQVAQEASSRSNILVVRLAKKAAAVAMAAGDRKWLPTSRNPPSKSFLAGLAGCIQKPIPEICRWALPRDAMMLISLLAALVRGPGSSLAFLTFSRISQLPERHFPM